MARKKTETAVVEPPPGEPPLAIPLGDGPPTEAPPPVEAPAEQPPANAGEKKKPVTSWRVKSDRTTSIELAVWSNTVQPREGEAYEQLSFTLARSYKTDQGWQKGGSYRAHDLPVLVYLLQKAHTFALDRRQEEIPF